MPDLSQLRLEPLFGKLTDQREDRKRISLGAYFVLTEECSAHPGFINTLILLIEETEQELKAIRRRNKDL